MHFTPPVDVHRMSVTTRARVELDCAGITEAEVIRDYALGTARWRSRSSGWPMPTARDPRGVWSGRSGAWSVAPRAGLLDSGDWIRCALRSAT